MDHRTDADAPLTTRRTRRHTKTESTRSAIFAAAMRIAKTKGLQHVTLNAVASPIGLTRSGVSKHVGSVEELQHSLVDRHQREFIEQVFEVAMQAPRGLPRLDALIDRWFAHVDDMQVFILSEVIGRHHGNDDPRGRRIQAHALDGIQDWRRALERAVDQSVQQGHLRADTDPAQMAFELLGIMTVHLCTVCGRLDAQATERARRAYATLLSGYRVCG